MLKETWNSIPDHLPNVECGEFMVMPNHFHGIVTITTDKQDEPDVGARHAVPQQKDAFERFGKLVSGSFSTIIRSFKSATTKAFHEFPGHSDDRLWQLGYYDRVIRNEREYEAIYEYIITNPMNWEKDEEFFVSQ